MGDHAAASRVCQLSAAPRCLTFLIAAGEPSRVVERDGLCPAPAELSSSFLGLMAQVFLDTRASEAPLAFEVGTTNK